jgi:hypothetical protein
MYELSWCLRTTDNHHVNASTGKGWMVETPCSCLNRVNESSSFDLCWCRALLKMIKSSQLRHLNLHILIPNLRTASPKSTAKMGNLVSSLRWNAFESFFSYSGVRNLFISTRKLSSSAPKKAVPLLEPFEEPRAKHIVIVGGAYAGLSTLLNLQNILSGAPHVPGPYIPPAVSALPRTSPKITLLDERDGIYHTIGTPLVHTSPDVATNTQRMWKKYEDIPYLRDVRVVQGRVQSVDPVRKELVYLPSNWSDSDGEKGKTMAYDYLVCATGLKRAWPVQPRATTKADFIRDTNELVEELIEAKESVVIVGGG